MSNRLLSKTGFTTLEKMILNFAALLLISGVQSMLNSSRIAEIFKDFSEKKLHLAPRKKGEKVKVELALVIQNMVPLKFLNNHIYMEMDILMRWSDPRLRFEHHSSHDSVIIRKEEDIFFWRPDIYINGEKGIKYEMVPEKLTGVWVFPDGTVFYASRLTVAVACPMKLNFFPFDKQTCHVKFESYAYNSEQLQLELLTEKRDPVTFGKPFLIAKFILEKYELVKGTLDHGVSGVFDQIKLIFHFKRDIRYYMTEYYLPVISMVILSFISFWIHFNAVPARTALPLTTLLTMSKMISHVRSSAALYGTADALEIFLNTSMFFVIAVLVEYGAVHLTDHRWLKKNEEMEKVKKIKIESHAAERSEDRMQRTIYTTLKNFEEKLMMKHLQQREEGHYFDYVCRYLFPLSYFGFLILYIVVYIHV